MQGEACSTRAEIVGSVRDKKSMPEKAKKFYRFRGNEPKIRIATTFEPYLTIHEKKLKVGPIGSYSGTYYFKTSI